MVKQVDVGPAADVPDAALVRPRMRQIERGRILKAYEITCAGERASTSSLMSEVQEQVL